MADSERIPVAIVGASGYTGAELIRLLSHHPHVEIRALYARKSAGEPIARVFPHLIDLSRLTVEAFDADAVVAKAKVVFSCLPHGDSAKLVGELHARGATVLDLSADFRLRDPADYARWYGTPEHPDHPLPELLPQAVFGLPERHREALRGARLIAVPGCYPTAAILGLAPLLAAGLIAKDSLIIDAKSGVSGAGRSPTQSTHFPDAGEGVRAYKIAGTHRHTAEIEQELARAAGADPGSLRVLFTPHLVPMTRGILSVGYAVPSAVHPAGAYRQALLDAYAPEPFVSVVDVDQPPDTQNVRGSNRAHVGAWMDSRTGRVIVMAAIDNLVKGASGQAVQCMNLALGLPETAGLEATPLFP